MDSRSSCGLLTEEERVRGGNFQRGCSLKMKENLADPVDFEAYQTQQGRSWCVCACVAVYEGVVCPENDALL